MALKAGYKGIKKYIADKLNALGDVDSLATDAEVEQTLRDAEVVQGKNFLNPEVYEGYSSYFNVNADGSVTCLASDTRSFADTNKIYLPAGEYVFSKDSDDRMIITDGSINIIDSAASSAEFTLSTAKYITAKLSVGGTYPVTIKGMICTKEEWDKSHDYEPYYIPLKDVVLTKADNSVIGTVEDGTNPTKAYSVGEHFIRNGKFCTVTVDVTTSSTWTLGSNYAEGDVASELDYEEYTGSFTFDNVSCGYGIKKVGRNVSIYIYMPNVTITNGAHILFTLPSEYIPLSYARAFSGIGISTGDWASAEYYNYCIRVNTNGSVILCGDNISNIKYVIFSADYII